MKTTITICVILALLSSNCVHADGLRGKVGPRDLVDDSPPEEKDEEKDEAVGTPPIQTCYNLCWSDAQCSTVPDQYGRVCGRCVQNTCIPGLPGGTGTVTTGTAGHTCGGVRCTSDADCSSVPPQPSGWPCDRCSMGPTSRGGGLCMSFFGPGP